MTNKTVALNLDNTIDFNQISVVDFIIFPVEDITKFFSNGNY